MSEEIFDWIALSREMKSMAEAGIRYSENPYDVERYRRLLELSALPMKGAVCGFDWPHELGYATPKVDVRAAVFDEAGRILLVQEAATGEWTLPGGWADLNFSAAENAAKEVWEEAGLVVEVEKLIACWDKDRRGHPRQPEHVYKLLFSCRRIGGELATNHETSGVGFFPVDELPVLCPHRAGRSYIDIAVRHAADPSLPTDFD